MYCPICDYKLYRLKLKAKLPIRMPKGGNENELP